MSFLRNATSLALAWAYVCPGAEPSKPRPWNEYQTIMWIGDTAYKRPDKMPVFFQRLREMGINTGMVYGGGDPAALVQAGYPYYVENIVNRGLCLKFNSKVADWDKTVTDWSRHDRPENALVRDYCLDDPKWLASAQNEMREAARRNAPNHPLALDIRDELSTTFSANPFDYDFNPIALANFRDWLKTQYPNLKALNAEWETAFSSWSDVRPFTTDQIKNRMVSGEMMPRGKPDWHAVQAIQFDAKTAREQPAHWNFSPWADFRSYMDVSLARTLGELRRAAHEVDPATPVGIEGAQMPSAFGGYDLARLGPALDWVEPYDIGNAREIFGSFMADKPMLTTVFEKDAESARRRLWHLLLEGDRGCLIWWSEDCIDWSSPDYALTAKAKALAPVLKEMTAPLARLFLRAERERDPIAIHYSQASIQADWLIESTVDGSTWLRRFSSFEAEHNRFAKVRNGLLKAIQDAGYRPEFVSSDQIENSALSNRGFRALALPESLALSAKEIERIDAFYAQGGTVLSTGPVGAFDQHGRLQTNQFAREWIGTNGAQSIFSARGRGERATGPGKIEQYAADRLRAAPAVELPNWIGAQLALTPEVSVPIESRTLIHRFKIGNARLIALERNINYQMSEDLAQAGGNEQLEKTVEVAVLLPNPAHVYDLRQKSYLGRVNHFTARLDPWQPALFAVLPEKAELAAWINQAISSAE